MISSSRKSGYSPIDGPTRILAQGAEWLSKEAQRWTRVGLGHPEGFFEAFANNKLEGCKQ
jgi:hypothetical protein